MAKPKRICRIWKCKYCGKDCDENPCEKRVAIAVKVVQDLITHDWQRDPTKLCEIWWVCNKCGSRTRGDKYVRPCNHVMMERALM